jgi:hypothetical protein
MGIRPRIFLVPEDDSIRHLPLARYVRLLRQDPNERLPEYAGKHIRYALASVDEISWTPVKIERIQYSYLSFDSSGRLDLTERRKNIEWVSDVSTISQKERGCQKVVDARRRFAQKRFESKYKWAPTLEITKCIFTSIFGE